MKRQKKLEKKEEKPFALKWKSVRIFPNADFTNAMELTETRKYKIDSLEEYIDTELDLQNRGFARMGCDKKLSEAAIAALRAAYESSAAAVK